MQKYVQQLLAPRLYTNVTPVYRSISNFFEMPYYAKLMNRSITIAVLAGALFGAAISYNFKSWIVSDGGQVFVTANGAAV